MLTAEMNGVGGGDMVSEEASGGDGGSLEVAALLCLVSVSSIWHLLAHLYRVHLWQDHMRIHLDCQSVMVEEHSREPHAYLCVCVCMYVCVQSGSMAPSSTCLARHHWHTNLLAQLHAYVCAPAHNGRW